MSPEFNEKIKKFFDLVNERSKDLKDVKVSREFALSGAPPTHEQVEYSKYYRMRLAALQEVFSEEIKQLNELYNERAKIPNQFHKGAAAYRHEAENHLMMIALKKIEAKINAFLEKNPHLKFVELLRQTIGDKKF